MAERSIRSVCVYCGSRPGVNGAYAEVARALGRELVSRDLTLVYGGGRVGLMGILAVEVLAGGGRVVGVIPGFMVAAERAHGGVTEQIVVGSMHERKAIMSARCDAIVTLPGGVGTFDELFEAITWNLLGVHERPLGVIDVGGYYGPLRVLLEHAVEHGFLMRATADSIRWGEDAGGVLDALGAARA